jgi:hypothetical protein
VTARPLLLALAALLSLGPACKRKDTVKVEIFDDAPPPALTEALGALAPPWPAPSRVVLGNGLLVHWLHEPDAAAVHLSLVFPTYGLKASQQGAAALIAARAVALQLEGLATRLALRVEFTPRTGRYEIAVHGVDADLPAILSALGDLLAAPGRDLLARARKTALTELRPPDAEALALGAVTSMLLGTDPAAEQITAQAVADVPDPALQNAWEALTDPRRALLIVHAGDPLATHDPALAAFGARWRHGLNLLAGTTSPQQALVRLRTDAPKSPGERKHLKKPPVAPLVRIDPSGRGGRSLLVLGRTIPTPTVKERSLARIVQRHLQGELDIRLSVHGELALATIHIPLTVAGRGKPQTDPLEQVEGAEPPTDPGAADPLSLRVRRELTVIRDYLRERPLAQDLVGAAQLWLGARMVAASLRGEDWTALWSEAIDLSTTDGEIAAALARDAGAMLAASPEDAAAFMKRWLDLETSEPGWAWVVVGPEDELKGVVASQGKGLQFDPPPE